MVKRISALLLAVLMLVGVVGCKDEPEEEISVEYQYEYEYEYEDSEEGEDASGDAATPDDGGNAGGTGNSGTGAHTNTGNKNLEGNTYLSGFPIVKNKEKITIMCTNRADLGDIANSEFDKTYEEMTGMQIDWQLVNEGDVAQRRTLALQSGDLPDVMCWNVTDNEMVQYSAEGAFYEIKKADLKKWAPNIYATYDLYPEAWELTKLENGKMYSISTMTKDFPYDQHFVWVRKSWLKNVGMSMPTTMDQFYDVLKAFKEKDPNGNGQKDEIPYATWSSGGFFTHPWGFVEKVSVNTKGKVVHSYSTDNFQKAFTFWNKIYKEDLVNKDVIDKWAGNNAAFKTLISGGKVGAFFYGWPTEAMDDKLIADYEIMKWPTSGGSNGDLPSVAITTSDIVSRCGFVISAKTKNPTAVLRFLDYLYTDDGYMLKQYGTPGNYYKKTGNNTYALTGKALSANSGPKWAVRGRSFLQNSKITNEVIPYHTQQRYNVEAWCESTIKSSGQKELPSAFMTKKENQQVKLYSTYFDTELPSFYTFVKGTKTVNDLTALRSEMKNKGLDKYLNVLQGFYDRVNKK